MKIKLYSQYDHFPHYHPEDGESFVEIYNDGKIWEAFASRPNGECALLIEPRPLQEENYKMLETKYARFKYVFTHDSQLLRIAPNALPICWWNEYSLNDEPKIKDISMICGIKDYCPLHIERMKIAEELKGKIDILGDIWGQPRVSIHDAYAPYKFAVIIENHVDDGWFTEKLLNCFANKTIPIYFGGKAFIKYFNQSGIIEVDNLHDIPLIIKNITEYGVDKIYQNLKMPVEENYLLVQKYENFEDWFIKEYGGLLNDIINNNSGI